MKDAIQPTVQKDVATPAAIWTFVITSLLFWLVALGYDSSYPGSRYLGLIAPWSLSFNIGEPSFAHYLVSGIVVSLLLLYRILCAMLVGAICGAVVWCVIVLHETFGSGNEGGTIQTAPRAYGNKAATEAPVLQGDSLPVPE